MSNSYENLKKYILGLIIAGLIILIYYIISNFIKYIIYSDSFINYNNYQIIKKYNHKDKAYELLSNIDQNVYKLINAFNIKYSNIYDLNICNKQKNY